MIVTTKFAFNQWVCYIGQERPRVWETCPTCEGKGRIEINGESFPCPKNCHYGKLSRLDPRKWMIQGSGEVKCLWLRLYADPTPEVGEESCYYHYTQADDERNYMLSTTGVGSGTLHKECDMFTSREEAQAECDRRNAEGIGEEE